MIECISAAQQAAGITTDTSLLNFVVTDGRTLIATRFVSPLGEEPASLYYAEGTSFRCAVASGGRCLSFPRSCSAQRGLDHAALRAVASASPCQAKDT
jgi:hypothetical protein